MIFIHSLRLLPERVYVESRLNLSSKKVGLPFPNKVLSEFKRHFENEIIPKKINGWRCK